MANNKIKIYLDDVRTPVESDWVIVRNYEQFVDLVSKTGFENISVISLDHDLGDSAMQEYYNNVSPFYKLDYSNINERTGYDCAKWLVDYYYDNYHGKSQTCNQKRKEGIIFPLVYTHSANPIGSANIMGYINNFLMNEAQPQSCNRVGILHTIDQ